MPLLYFWRGDNHRRDLDEGAAYHLNQSSPRLHEVGRGDSVWAFTRNARGRYAVAAELVVRAKTRNPPGYAYGPYRVWGDRSRSRYFAVDGAPDAEPLIRGFALAKGPGVLGRSFQGPAAVRALSVADHQSLALFAQHLPLEPRARPVDEERLEFAVARASPEALTETTYGLGGGMSLDRRQWILREAVPRSRAHVEALRRLYGGRCQLCAWESRTAHAVDVCEGHHLQWLGRGGDDRMENMVLLCPNHHRLVHALDAPLDFDDLAFDLGERREVLRINEHLRRAA
ncbi:MAG: hypothetical protein U0324_07675 [Polyangiales bacterium]